MTTTAPPRVDHSVGPFTADRPAAPWGLRVLATLLDSSIVASVAFLAAGASPSLATLPGLGNPDGTDGGAWTAGTLVVLAVLQAYTGMTPGKRVAGISVVDDRSGTPIGLPGTVLRWFAHLLDALLLIGYLRAAFHREGRTFADSLLGTVAVRTTTPEAHPLVARLRRARDAGAPWLRWPRRVTGAVALVVCAAAAAASLTPGSGGGTTMAASEPACDISDPTAPYLAQVGASFSERGESRLGIWRLSERGWTTVVAWSSAPAGTDGHEPLPDGATATLVLRSPEGGEVRTGETVSDPFGPDGPWWSMPGDEPASASLETAEDPAGWTVRSALVDAGGVTVAECSGTVPPVDRSSRPWVTPPFSD
ncbi:RDD family protein [Isoptericola sp. NPDC019693]|uniref:RDD family protein n=1 Tax=Isoptericola sp. NPDC019693 TaxID=3364009 RepID=UPI00378A69D8